MSVNHQVRDFSTHSSSSDQDLAKEIVAKLKKQGQLSVETVGQLLNTMSDNLNSQSSNAEQRKVTLSIQAKPLFALSLKMQQRSSEGANLSWLFDWCKNVLSSVSAVEAPSVAAPGINNHSENGANQHSSGGSEGCQGAG